MPRKAKDENEVIEENKVKKTATKKSTTTKKTTASKKSTSKKPVEKKAATTAKKEKVTEAKTKAKTTKKASTSKKATTTKKTATTKKTTTAKKTTEKKTKTSTKKEKDVDTKPKTEAKSKTKTTKKSTTKKAATTKKSTTRSSKKVKEESVDLVEYYDLPYRYNETIVKILAQTPDVLFVYWDISDNDKQEYINKYGEFFFNDTKPVLIIHNDTMNYSFEVEINDYANSWYVHINDSNCDYSVELGRKPINQYAKIDNYLHISSSNEIDAPNDHILFDTLDKIVYFRNVKTNSTFSKDISLSFLTKLGKIYNIKEFYRKLYKDENIDFDKLNLKNMPSS